jgi:hypothetical protein
MRSSRAELVRAAMDNKDGIVHDGHADPPDGAKAVA